MARTLRLDVCFGKPVLRLADCTSFSACNSGIGITPPASKCEELPYWQRHRSIELDKRQAGGDRMAARSGREHWQAWNPQGRGTSASGGNKSVSGRRAPPQSRGAIRTSGKGRGGRLPGVGEGADVLAATRSSSPHDHGEDR